jgi:predicted GIY-YIG superfamily endonuclease
MSAETASGACFLYILFSESADRYYVGVSSDPHRRLEFHNTKERGFTARYRPWKLVFIKEYTSRSEAQGAEKKIKNWKSQKMIIQLINGEIPL